MARSDDIMIRCALAICFLPIVACAPDFGLEAPPNQNSSDAGRPMLEPPIPQPLTAIREDFITRELISNTVNVIHDVNEGLVRLPTTRFPEAIGGAIRTYDYDFEVNGVIAADQIVVMPEGALHASDSVELIATELVRVNGQVVAGPGGVTIAAGRSVIIDGTIESRGPIRIMLSDPTGTIEVGGRVIGYSTGEREVPSSIELLGRGSMLITGSIATKASASLTSGQIVFDSYGDIRIVGAAEISTTADGPGATGMIRIRSESKVEIINGSWIGDRGTMLDPLLSDLTSAGDIEIQAPEVELGDNTTIVGASALESRGASIMVTAGRTLRLGVYAILAAGAGLQGGSILIHAGTANLGQYAFLNGGMGLSAAGLLRIEASTALSLSEGTNLRGGDGVCADGGSTTVFVAGVLTLATGSVISGGGGGISANQRPCALQGYRGGSVDVIAHRVEGDESGIRVGEGLFHAERQVNINPYHEVPAPNLTVSASGWVESHILDRGEESIGQAPALRLLLEKDKPLGTNVKLELAGAPTLDVAIDQWIVLDKEDSSNLEVLRDARYFRYKLTLVGRAFDTPVVDFFEIDLAPAKDRGR